MAISLRRILTMSSLGATASGDKCGEVASEDSDDTHEDVDEDINCLRFINDEADEAISFVFDWVCCCCCSGCWFCTEYQ